MPPGVNISGLEPAAVINSSAEEERPGRSERSGGLGGEERKADDTYLDPKFAQTFGVALRLTPNGISESGSK